MIDVNETRYHLLLGADDWSRCIPESGEKKWEYNDSLQSIQLQQEIFQFASRGAVPETALVPDQRRGAARDSFGHWYWLDDTSTRIMALWARASQPEVIFPTADESPHPDHDSPFSPSQPAPVQTEETLAGLAITGEGYLVVGSPQTGTLLVYDLHSTDGGPLRLRLPEPPTAPGEHTLPFDLAALPAGGALVLDSHHKIVWMLDNSLQPVPTGKAAAGGLLTFQPKTGRARREPTRPPVQPVDLSMTQNPISVEPLPDDTFLILDSPAGGDVSTLWRFSVDGSFEPQSVVLLTSNLLEDNADDLDLRRIRGHDMAYVPDRTLDSAGRWHQIDQSGVVFIVDVNGNQAYALSIVLSPDALEGRIQREYYPLRSFTGVALLSVWEQGLAYYHQGSRWLPIKALPTKRYEEEAVLLLPVLDGRDPGCVWHRLCIDACIPPETEISIHTRVADVADDLQWQPWVAQPTVYQRPDGGEIPYSSLWRETDLAESDTGTWELLFQAARGRYLQLCVTLRGNKRSTPMVRALRAHYPRFSYLQQYLPTVYQQDPASMQFVEQYLANMEGIFTTIEGIIAQVQVLLDVRTLPADAVDWLASWIGMAFESGWDDYQRRLLIAQAPYFLLRRGTLPGMMQAIMVVVSPELGVDIFRDDIDQYCATIRIVERFFTRTVASVAAGDPTGTDDSIVLTDSTDPRAHRFTVLLPTTVDAAKMRLVKRIVELEKPAHTSFTIKQYWAMFRVGEVRVGIDTVLGQGGRFEVFQVGQTALAEGALGAAFPFDLINRTVISN